MVFFDNFINTIETLPVFSTIKGLLMPLYQWYVNLFNSLNVTFVSAQTSFVIIFGLLCLIVFIVLIKLIFGKKKMKITFIAAGQVYAKRKAKYKKKINFPEAPIADGYEFVGWFTDEACTNQYVSTTMKSKKKLNLYAKFEPITEEVAQQETIAEPIVDTAVEVSEQISEPIVDNTCEQVEQQNDVVEIESQDKETLIEQPNEEVESEVEETSAEVESEPIEVQTESVVEPTIEPMKEDVKVAFTVNNASRIKEEVIEPIVEKTIGDLYDGLRNEMLTFVKADAFDNIGLSRKHIIAEMFEKDGEINLYLAVSPELMLLKGYNVEKYSQAEFSIVPCKKVVKTEKDYFEAIEIIKEAMLFNNLVKHEDIIVNNAKSTEKIRKMGFAFFVKNETVLSTAEDIYKLLRANVLSYMAGENNEIASAYNNKMILKIFKKEEEIFVYLALNAEKEGLEFVGFDKNFADTPAMCKIETIDDVLNVYYLVDKLMYQYGLEKHPEIAEEISGDALSANCGFGYRIKI